MKKTIDINFKDLLTGVQEAFAGREKGSLYGHQKGSGEKAITEYFKTQGVEIALNNAALHTIASRNREVTRENLQELLDDIGCQTKDQAEGLAKQQDAAATKIQSVFRGNQGRKDAEEARNIHELMNIDVVSGSTKKSHQERKDAYDAKSTVAVYQNPKDEKDQESNSLMADYLNELEAIQRQAEKRGRAGGIILPSGGQPIALTADGDFAKAAANNLIIKAYNECVTEKSMTADDFAIKLFGDTFKRTAEMKTLAQQSKEIFTSLHSQYGNNEIKDNLAKVEKDPTTWEKIKDFISNLLSYVGVNLGTNAGDKDKYKANKPESKSLLDHAAKKPAELSK